MLILPLTLGQALGSVRRFQSLSPKLRSNPLVDSAGLSPVSEEKVSESSRQSAHAVCLIIGAWKREALPEPVAIAEPDVQPACGFSKTKPCKVNDCVEL